MINNRFTETFSVSRQVWTTDNDGFESSDIAQSHTFKGLKQQITAEDSQYMNLSFNKSFTIFCPLDTDIKETDVIGFDGFDYGVRNLIDYRDGKNAHKQVYIELLGETGS